MRKLALLTFLCASVAGAQTCKPGNMSGCPTTIPGTPGSTTPTAVTGSGYTIGGVTTASVDVINQAQYNPTVCPGTNTTGDGGCTVTVFMPHEAPSNSANYEKIYVYHGGGLSAGNAASSDGFANGTGCCQSSILWVQQKLGTPNAAGGKGIIIYQVNYREVPAGGGFNANIFPAQYQDAKCAWQYTNANSSTFPGNTSIMGMYGPSAGGLMVQWAARTPDNVYTTSCPVSAPGTDPTFIAVEAWSPVVWLCMPGGGTACIYGNGSFDNVTQTQAYRNLIKSEMNSATEATIQTNCSGFGTYGCDPFQNIILGNALLSQPTLFIFGYYNNSLTLGDILVMPYCNTNGVTTGCTGGAAMGNLYGLSAQYNAQTTIHPFMEILAEPCPHECDLANTWPNIPSLNDAFNFLMATGQPLSGNLNGTL